MFRRPAYASFQQRDHRVRFTFFFLLLFLCLCVERLVLWFTNFQEGYSCSLVCSTSCYTSVMNKKVLTFEYFKEKCSRFSFFFLHLCKHASEGCFTQMEDCLIYMWYRQKVIHRKAGMNTQLRISEVIFYRFDGKGAREVPMIQQSTLAKTFCERKLPGFMPLFAGYYGNQISLFL